MKTRLVLALALLIFTISGAALSADTIIVLHTNDIHARIEASDESMGMAKLAAIVEEYRQSYDHVIVLDGGDTIHGLPIANVLQGRSVVDTMNAVGYDAMVPGNHDFHFGFSRLMELADLMEFSLVAANVTRGGSPVFLPHVIIERGPYQIGIFGLATPATLTTTNPRNIRGLTFEDMAAAAQVQVEQLQEQGVDLIIALGHVGLDGNYPSPEVVEQVSGVHLFVDGHSHHALASGQWHNNTLLVQAGQHLRYMGVVEITMTPDGPADMAAHLISRSEALEYDDDPLVRTLLDEAEAEWVQIHFGN